MKMRNIFFLSPRLDEGGGGHIERFWNFEKLVPGESQSDVTSCDESHSMMENTNLNFKIQ